MYVITVEFMIKPDRLDAFIDAIQENATTSLQIEDGCHGFDVCQSEADPNRIFLYELYTEKEAFEAHLESEHFREFNDLSSEWVESKKVDSWVWNA
ncbi:MAG: putative quinol monooxygenase [Verrucomicrobiota bacterium]